MGQLENSIDIHYMKDIYFYTESYAFQEPIFFVMKLHAGDQARHFGNEKTI